MPAAPTATQQLAQLDELRNANGGYVVPPPPTLSSARLLEPVDPDDRRAGQAVPNKAMQEATAWLRAIAEIGSPEDLTLAWETWRIPSGTPAIINAKLHLLSMFEQLRDSCGARWRLVWEAAERERQQEVHVAELRAQHHRAKAEADAIHRDYIVACDKARKIEVQIEALQRKARGELVH